MGEEVGRVGEGGVLDGVVEVAVFGVILWPGELRVWGRNHFDVGEVVVLVVRRRRQ